MPRLQVRLIQIPLLYPFTTSFGTEKARTGLVLELESDGVTAYSECVASENPYYSYEDNDTALHMIKDHLVRLIGGLPRPEEFIERSEGIKGHNMAKAAIEMLLWDYHCKVEKKAMHVALGETKGYADVGISIGIDDAEATRKRVDDAIKKGYKRVKVKIEKGKEYQIISAIRDMHPDVPLSADANSCYSLKDRDALKRLDKFDLVYLEQPLDHDDIIDHAKLSRELSTPICLDESISSVDKARQAFEIGATQVINIKPGRLGGLGNSLKVAEIARRNGGHVWVGGMFESGIGRAFNVAFASLKLVDYPGDTSPNEKYFTRDIVGNPFVMREGTLRPNEGPGIGVRVDEDFLSKVAKKSWKIS